MKIGVDIDGVIADSFPVFQRELNKHYGKDITRIDHYDIAKVYNVEWEDMGAFFDNNVEYLFSAPEPMAGALETLKAWQDQGHEIVIVTARGCGLEEKVTLEWLGKHKIPYRHIVFAGGASKTLAVREYKLDAFIDDFISNALEIAALDIPVFLLDAPYNQGELPQGVTRCCDWQDIQCKIAELCGTDI